MPAGCGVGASRRRDAQQAAVEAVRAALERAGAVGARDVLLFATAGYGDARSLVAAAHAASDGARVIGCAGSGVLSSAGEIEDDPGVVALVLPEDIEVRPFLCGARGPLTIGDDERGLLALFADGYSMHPERLADAVSTGLPTGTPIVGGLAVGERGVAPAWRWLGDDVTAEGSVGMWLGGAEMLVGVAQGCRPVGTELTVTRAWGNVIAELDGRPAFHAFAEIGRPLLDDLRRAAQTIFVALYDEGGRDFVVRGLVGFEPDEGMLALSEPVPVGGRLRFAVRESYGCRENLRRALAGLAERLAGRTPRFGLYFNCAGRGRSLLGVADHDVAVIHSSLGDFPLVGFFGGGELGPCGGRTRLHLFTGVLALAV